MKNTQKPSALIDFEIEFYEQLVEKYPDFVDVLIPLAEAYTRKGCTQKGLAIDQQLVRLRQEDPCTWYNLSCSYSLLNRVDESSQAMHKAIACGYDDLKHLQRDSDLANLRRSKYFPELLASIEKRKHASVL